MVLLITILLQWEFVVSTMVIFFTAKLYISEKLENVQSIVEHE